LPLHGRHDGIADGKLLVRDRAGPAFEPLAL
jgi:hypothetical protein